MRHRGWRRWTRHGAAARMGVLFLLATLLVSACADPRGLAAHDASTSASPSANILDEADTALGALYRGTFRPPDITPRPAAKSKKLVVISAGQASPSSSIPTAAVVEAATALGWAVQVYDLQFNPALAPKLVRDAIAAGADAVMPNFDCALARAAFAEARAKRVAVVPLYGFDCDDPGFGPGGPALFSTSINYGFGGVKPGVFIARFGGLWADAVINATNGQAKVIIFDDPSLSLLRYVNQGFVQQLRRCAGCTVVATVQFTGAELGARLQQKVASTLLQHPEANAIRTPYTAATLLGIAPAVVQSGRADKLFVIGGEGYPQDLDLIRTGKGLNACLLSDPQWTAWAAVDSLNSYFIGQPPRVAGLGTILVDRTHNLPPSGSVTHSIDYRAAYKQAWGVG